MSVAGPEGEPAGDPDLRHAGRLRRRAGRRASGPARRRDRRGRPDGRQPGDRARSCSRPRPTRRWPARWPRSRGKPADPKLERPLSSSSSVDPGHWARTTSRSGRGPSTAWPSPSPKSAPYTIEIVEPKVPLVRGGSMGLKVVAHRKPGFKAPIAVYLPWNPPGVGSSGGVTIPEGRTRPSIPMNARRRRRAADLEDRGQRPRPRRGVASRPDRLASPSQLANLTIAAAVPHLRASRPRASSRARRPTWRQGDQGWPTSPARPR